MTSEPRMFPIVAFRTPDGRPTCTDNPDTACPFLRVTHFGTRELCVMTDLGPIRPGGTGYLVPTNGCPVWADSAMEVKE